MGLGGGDNVWWRRVAVPFRQGQVLPSAGILRAGMWHFERWGRGWWPGECQVLCRGDYQSLQRRVFFRMSAGGEGNGGTGVDVREGMRISMRFE